MSGGRRLTTTPRSTRSGQKDGMISVLRSSNSKRKIRYYSLPSRICLFGHGKLKSKWEEPYLVLNAANHCSIILHYDDGNIQGQWPRVESVSRAQNIETQRNRCLRVIQARAPVYGHHHTLNMPYLSLV